MIWGVSDLLKTYHLGPVYGVHDLSIHLHCNCFKWARYVVTSGRVIYAIHETCALACSCVAYRRVSEVVVTRLHDTCARAKCRCCWKCRRKFRRFPDAPVAHSKMHKNECKCLCNRLNFGPYENAQNTVLTEKEKKTVTPLVLDWEYLQVNIWQDLHSK